MNKCFFGDCRDVMRDLVGGGTKVQTCVTSPPYWNLRDYGVEGQLGLEETPEQYIDNLVEVFELVRELLADDGTLWLNLGDTYAHSGCGGASEHTSTLQGGLTSKNASKTVKSRRRDRESMPRQQTPTGYKKKDLMGMPWRVAFALQAAGWYLRRDIIWHKPNPMPESCKDRPTTAHEYIFLMSKNPDYYYDQEAIAENRSSNNDSGVAGWVSGPEKHNAISHNRDKGDAKTFRGGQYTNNNKFNNSHASDRDSHGNKPAEKATRNRRSVWTVATHPYPEAHFATFPPDLIKPCILAGSRAGDIVLDPFLGSGTTAQVAQELGRQWIGIELNQEYKSLQKSRVGQMGMPL